MRKVFVSVALLLSAGLVFGQESKRPDNWFNLDYDNDKVNGVSTEKTYNELLKGKKSTPVIVAVLDSGVDYKHEDLKDVMWVNKKEIPGNGIDDDKNGYIDDIHGWSFLGNKDGRNVDAENLEMTRLYRKLKPKYEGKTKDDFKKKEELEELALFEAVSHDMKVTRDKYEPAYNQLKYMKEGIVEMEKELLNDSVKEITSEVLANYNPEDKKKKQMKAIVGMSLKKGATMAEFKEQIEGGWEQVSTMIEVGLNPDANPREVVGDNYDNQTEKNYGNADCKGPGSFHGTHVAGIIAAKRGNGVGMDGVAANVQIMSVRCVPNGDEHDKDIANAIRYAVDNGAQIINMSFGKKYSWNKKVVDDAVKYAEKKGVFLVHAAGNDHLNIDTIVHYPTAMYLDKGYAKNMITVGALSWKPDSLAAAPFTNWGKNTVEIFAPGVDIYSTAPENEYKDASGTSMATPVVAGVAAVLKSYYPKLTAEQLKTILIKSSIKKYKGQKVIKPGTRKGDEDRMVNFEELCGNAGLVNLYEAVKMADKMYKFKD